MDAKHKLALMKAPLFASVNSTDRKILINCLSPQTRHYSKNEIVLLTGATVQHIGVVLSGTAHAYLEHINGDQVIMSRLKPMSVFGEILVSTRTHKSPVTIYATSECVIAFIQYERLFNQCHTACPAHGIFIQNMLKTIGDKYFRMFDRLNILSEKTLRAKILAYLYTQGEKGKAATITLPFSKTMLADYLLANRSALSKELHKMEKEGLITVKGREIEIS